MGNILNNNNDDSLSFQFDNKLAEVFDAIRTKDMEKIANYIQSGKNLDLTDDRSEVNNQLNNGKGETLLLRAIFFGDSDIVRMLIDAGANPNVINNISRETPLYVAAYIEDLPIMELLINGGADVNQLAGQNVQTPLHMATDMGKVGSVKLLLENGADLDIRNIEDKTACDIANYMDHSEIIQLLCYQNDNSSDEDIMDVDEMIDEDRENISTGRRLDFDNFFNFNDSSFDAIIEDLL